MFHVWSQELQKLASADFICTRVLVVLTSKCEAVIGVVAIVRHGRLGVICYCRSVT